MPGIPMPAVALYTDAAELLGFLVINGLPLSGGAELRACVLTGMGGADRALPQGLGAFLRANTRVDLDCAIRPEGEDLWLEVTGADFRAILHLDARRRGHWRVERDSMPVLRGRCELSLA